MVEFKPFFHGGEQAETFCKNEGVALTPRTRVYAAYTGDELLGYVIFHVEEYTAHVDALWVRPNESDDIYDGLLKSAIQAVMDEAALYLSYNPGIDPDLLYRLNFLPRKTSCEFSIIEILNYCKKCKM